MWGFGGDSKLTDFLKYNGDFHQQVASPNNPLYKFSFQATHNFHLVSL